MAVDFRLPNITGATEREQLVQIKNYLFTLVEQLQWAMNNIDTAQTNGSPSAVSGATMSKGASSSDSQVSFSELKSLIIKSGDIVNAYYEKINKRLEGIYVAQSDFGTFREQTSQYIEANTTTIEQNFTNFQEIVEAIDDNLRDTKTDVENGLEGLKGELKNIDHALTEVKANIKSGLLYYDENGTPVYGLEVGQRTMIDGVEVFDKYARFTSDRLSFYDQNDNEVAYISDRKLFINHVEIKGTLIMGGFVRTVLADGSIVKRWVIQGGEA